MPSRKKNLAAATHPLDCPAPQGLLMAVGGHESKSGQAEEGSSQTENRNFAPEAILKRFCEEVSGAASDPLVVIVPTASTEPEQAAADYVEAFTGLGLARLATLDLRTRSDASRPEFLDMVDQATGFWFTGGDQLRLTGLLGGTAMLQRLKERYTYERIVLAGTSAGAAAMSTPMIYEGNNNAGFLKGEITITTGLEFLRSVAIDTHFIARGRMVRMAQILATNPTCLGLGLEEDTAVVVHEGRELEVIGSGVVTVLESGEDTATNIYEIEPGTPFAIRHLRLHLLCSGDRYTLPLPPQLHR